MLRGAEEIEREVNESKIAENALSRFRSSASGDSSLQPVAEAHHEVDRPPDEAAPARNNEDAGYESRSSSHLLSNESSACSGQELATDEMSSGILRGRLFYMYIAYIAFETFLYIFFCVDRRQIFLLNLKLPTISSIHFNAS